MNNSQVMPSFLDRESSHKKSRRNQSSKARSSFARSPLVARSRKSSSEATSRTPLATSWRKWRYRQFATWLSTRSARGLNESYLAPIDPRYHDQAGQAMEVGRSTVNRSFVTTHP